MGSVPGLKPLSCPPPNITGCRCGLAPERAREEAIAATRELVRRRVVLGAEAQRAFPEEAGTTDLPDLEPTGT